MSEIVNKVLLVSSNTLVNGSGVRYRVEGFFGIVEFYSGEKLSGAQIEGCYIDQLEDSARKEIAKAEGQILASELLIRNLENHRKQRAKKS